MGLIGGIIQTFGNAGNQAWQQDWNEKMYGKQKEFWYEQQDYNSPANQVERLKEAGINPALAVGNIQSGQMGSAPAVPSMSAAQAGSFAGATDSILALINNKKQQRKLDSEALVNETDATLKEIDGYTRFVKNLQDIRESMSREDKNKVDAFVTDMLGEADYRLKQLQGDKEITQIEMNWLNYAKGLKELQFLPVQQRLEYAERMAEIAKIKAETSTEIQRKIKLIQETNHEFFKAKGQKFVNLLNEKTKDFLIKDREYQPYKGLGLDGVLIGKADADDKFFGLW